MKLLLLALIRVINIYYENNSSHIFATTPCMFISHRYCSGQFDPAVKLEVKGCQNCQTIYLFTTVRHISPKTHTHTRTHAHTRVHTCTHTRALTRAHAQVQVLRLDGNHLCSLFSRENSTHIQWTLNRGGAKHIKYYLHGILTNITLCQADRPLQNEQQKQMDDSPAGSGLRH